ERPLAWRLASALDRPDAGVVDQHVESAAQALDCIRHAAMHRSLVAHVALDDVLACGPDVEAHHAGATRAQLRRRGRTDPAGRARYHHPLGAHAATGTRAGLRVSSWYSAGSKRAVRWRK